MGLGLGGFLTPFRVHSPLPCWSAASLWMGAPALVPASPSIEATAADQKHDNDDDEKSCHIHDGASPLAAI